MGNTNKIENEVADVVESVAATAETAAERAEDVVDRADDLIREVSAKASRRFEEIRAEAGQYAGKAGEAVRGAADTGKGKAADALHGIAEAVRSLAGKAADSETGGAAADYAKRAADGMDKLSDVLKDKSLDDLGADVKDFVKEKPAIAIGVAAVLGFALARVLRSSGDDANEA
jgi:ElaB/YqjD/DUF883 family membrane-anchored ribosome-binding protein